MCLLFREMFFVQYRESMIARKCSFIIIIIIIIIIIVINTLFEIGKKFT